MNALLLLRKIYLISLVILISFFIQTCSKDPSSPSEEEIPKDVATIGIEGGTIEKNDFKLTVPAGAFDGNYDISISEVEDDGGFEDNVITPSFKISGLPNETNKNLIVKLKYKGTLTNNTYIIVDEKTKEDSLISSGLFVASDSNGYMVCNILKYSENGFGILSKRNKINDNSSDKIIYGITDFIEQKSPNFKYYIPGSYTSDIEEFKNNCENTLRYINEDVGLNFYPEENIRNIVLRKNTWSLLTSVTAIEWGVQIFFYVDKSKVFNNKFEYTNSDLGAILFGLESPREKFNSKNFIFRSLTYMIKELIYEDATVLLPFELEENKFEPFYGWAKENTVNSSIGFTPILKYLKSVSLLDAPKIGEILKKVNEGYTFQNALISSISKPIKEWLPDFFKKYVNNELYDFPSNYFLNDTYNAWNIDFKTDTLKTFKSIDVGAYNDLSSKIFKINLNHSEIKSNQNLSLLIDGPNYNEGLSLVLFSIKDNKVEYIGTSNETGAELKDLKGYYDLGIKEFLVILVNSNVTSPDYLGESNIDLELNIKSGVSGEPELNYNQCFIEVYVVANYYDTRYAEEYEHYTLPLHFVSTYEEYDYNNDEYIKFPIEGSFSGNTFTGSYDRGDGLSSTATIVLNETHDMVLEYSWAEVDTTYWDPNYYSNRSRSARGVSGTNIPIKNNEVGNFELSGLNTCSGVSTLLDFTKWEEVRFGNVNTDSSAVESFSCDENSRVIIQFSKE